MTHKTYELAEVQSIINILKTEEATLLNKRKYISSVIRKKRKAIKFWEELDISQYKAF
jgi:hypothetical protein